MQKLSRNDHIDLYRHLAFCAVGGFFGCYAVLIHSGVMGNAQTVNLIELLLDALRGDLHAVLLHLGALVLYVLGTMLTVLLPHWWGWDMHYVSPVITAAAAVTVAFLPETLNVVVALYPIFFAMSIQWSSFGGARGFSGGRSFSKSAPARVYAPSRTTVIKKNTTIIQSAPSSSSGGGFWSGVAGAAVGSMAGSAVYDALTDDKKEEVATPVQAPQPAPQVP